MTISVLALDVAKNRTGWALHSSAAASRPEWGSFVTDNFASNEGRELLAFEDLLYTLYQSRPFSVVVLENFFIDMKDFHFAGTSAQLALWYTAALWAERAELRCIKVPPVQWRKEVYGIGMVPKGEVREYWKKLAHRWCVERNWYPQEHDEAEALAIAEWALYRLDDQYQHRNGPLFRRQELNNTMKRGIHVD